MPEWRGKGASIGFVLDAPEPRLLAEFYAHLLGWRIAADEGDFVTVADPDDPSHYLAVQRQGDPSYEAPSWPAQRGRQQMMAHLDIETSSLDEAVAEAVSLGARVAEHQSQPRVRVLLDPVGHPFCIYTS